MSEAMHIDIKRFRRRDINMRFIINHAHGHMRIMDYRVGNYQIKRNKLDELARSEGLNKIFTLVEKQDARHWRTVGFHQEGVYPSFFRTTNAVAMSRFYDRKGSPITNTAADDCDNENAQIRVRKLTEPKGMTIKLVEDNRSRQRLTAGLNGELRALPFGRAEAPDIVLHAKASKKETWAFAEIDDSYGHATLAFAPTPSKEEELSLSAHLGNSLMPTLSKQEVNNIFGLAPIKDQWSNELFASLGFHITGQLRKHLRINNTFTNALIWHRRLSRNGK